MSIFEGDLLKGVTEILGELWKTVDAQKVPETTDVPLGNEAKKLEAVVLYADLRDSTLLVRKYKKHFAAEVYKTYLYCATRVIRHLEGQVTAFDGDRVMGVFIGDAKNSNAAKCGLKINYAITKIVQPALQKQYPKTDYTIKHTVGIDRSELWVARTGIRGNNDLVWVGNAANRAAKLSEQEGPATWITSNVYDRLLDSAKLGGDPTRNMWTQRDWSGETVYTSTWWSMV